jgi:hypothetical protein
MIEMEVGRFWRSEFGRLLFNNEEYLGLAIDR